MFFAVFSIDTQNRIGNTRGFTIDLAWFQYKILDKIVLVGKHTWDNLVKLQKNPLRYSTPIVVRSNLQLQSDSQTLSVTKNKNLDVQTMSINEVISLADSTSPICVAGGAQLINGLVSYIQDWYITIIVDHEFEDSPKINLPFSIKEIIEDYQKHRVKTMLTKFYESNQYTINVLGFGTYQVYEYILIKACLNPCSKI